MWLDAPAGSSTPRSSPAFRRVGHRSPAIAATVQAAQVHVRLTTRPDWPSSSVLPDEERQSVTGFLVRALLWSKSLSVRVGRVMAHKRLGLVSHLLRKACSILYRRHIRTRPYRPKTNGTAERFIETPLRERTYASTVTPCS
jgi:hypothetical protein